VADPQRVERDVCLCGELPGSFAPGLAVLAGDQQEPPTEYRARQPSNVIISGCCTPSEWT
jgi:hypothetical protein